VIWRVLARVAAEQGSGWETSLSSEVGCGWDGNGSPPPLIGAGRSIAPDGGACHRAKRGEGQRSDLDRPVAGATIIQVQGEGAPARRRAGGGQLAIGSLALGMPEWGHTQGFLDEAAPRSPPNGEESQRNMPFWTRTGSSPAGAPRYAQRITSQSRGVIRRMLACHGPTRRAACARRWRKKRRKPSDEHMFV
jgi:hypothetical protein